MHGLANVFGTPYPSHIMMRLALAVLLEMVHEAFLVQHPHLVGQCGVGWLRLGQQVVDLACRDRAVNVPDDGQGQ